MVKNIKRLGGRFCFFSGFATIVSMRYLGIDYGKKRIGLALSDPEGRIGFPFAELQVFNFRLTAKEIKKIIRQEKIVKVIIGLPRSFQGQETEQTREVSAFANKLKKEIFIPIEFENEMLTTKIAAKNGVKKEHLDASSAAIILQSYLDKIPNSKHQITNKF